MKNPKKANRYTEEEKIKLIEELKESGLSVSEFVKNKSVSDNSMYTWLKAYGSVKNNHGSILEKLEIKYEEAMQEAAKIKNAINVIQGL